MSKKLTELESKLLAALQLMYDKWENGDACYEDPEDYSGYLGSAFKLSSEEEDTILQAMEDAGVETALSFAKNVSDRRAA